MRCRSLMPQALPCFNPRPAVRPGDALVHADIVQA